MPGHSPTEGEGSGQVAIPACTKIRCLTPMYELCTTPCSLHPPDRYGSVRRVAFQICIRIGILLSAANGQSVMQEEL